MENIENTSVNENVEDQEQEVKTYTEDEVLALLQRETDRINYNRWFPYCYWHCFSLVCMDDLQAICSA